MLDLTVGKIGLFLNLIGTIILASGLIKSDKQIKLESTAFYGHNRFLLKSKKQARFLTILGLLIIALGFFLSAEYPNNNFQVDLFNGGFNKVLDLLVVFLGVFIAFWLGKKSKINDEKEAFFQMLIALQTEIQRNEDNLKTLKNSGNINISNILSLEVGNFFLNSSLSYKFGKIIVREIWTYLEIIRTVKSVSQSVESIDKALKITTETIISIEEVRKDLFH